MPSYGIQRSAIGTAITTLPLVSDGSSTANARTFVPLVDARTFVPLVGTFVEALTLIGGGGILSAMIQLSRED
jgi:hypothetical protein